ncbi:MAG TPA: AI-2E family transporter [Candidatus Saccharimonadales bacterium]|nr:AI-2E family transporter [Candidatus Saccharimonadales bacterium]
MKQLKLEIDNLTFIRFLVIATGFLLGLFLLYKLLPALTIILVAFVLMLALNPSVHALSRYMPKQNRIYATAIVFLVLLGIISLFFYIVLPPMIEQTTNFISSLPNYVSAISQNQGPVAELIARYELQDELASLAQNLKGQVFNVAGGLGVSVITGVTSIFGGLALFVTVLVLTFLMLIEAPRWAERAWSLYVDKQKLAMHKEVIASMYKVVGSYVNGQVLVAFISGVFSLVALVIIVTVFGLSPGIALPMAGVVFMTSLIPMIGATVGSIIILLVLLLNGSVGAAVSFLVYFVVYQQIENNFIQPIVQSRTVALSALGVFVAVILGFALLGPLGGILAIPLAGCLRILVLHYLKHKHKAAISSEDFKLKD